MPAGDPIVLQITDAIDAWLRGITTANGFAADVTVNRWKDSGNEFNDNSIILQPDGPEIDREPARLGGQEPDALIRWTQPFRMIAAVRESQSSTTPLDRRLQILRSDIERRIASGDPTWGGLAHDTRLEPPEFHFDIVPAMVVVKIAVTYHTYLKDPRTQPSS